MSLFSVCAFLSDDDLRFSGRIDDREVNNALFKVGQARHRGEIQDAGFAKDPRKTAKMRDLRQGSKMDLGKSPFSMCWRLASRLLHYELWKSERKVSNFYIFKYNVQIQFQGVIYVRFVQYASSHSKLLFQRHTCLS